MSRTEYGRRHVLRMDDEDRHVLALLVMGELTRITARVEDRDDLQRRRRVATLRSLLERLSQ